MTSMQPESAASMSGSGTPASGSGTPANLTSSVTPGVDISGADIQAMTYQQIMPRLQGLKPDQFTEAAKAFQKLGSTLETIRKKVQDTGDSLASNQSWRGAAAQKAMDKFQDMHDQTSVLSAQCNQAGAALDWFGGEATPPYVQLPTPQVMSTSTADEIMAAPLDVTTMGASSLAAWGAGKMGIGPNGQNTADKAAREYMTSYNQQIGKLDKALPNDSSPGSIGGDPWTQKSSTQPGTGGGTQLPGSGPVGGGVPGSAAPGAGARVPGSSSPPGANPFAAPGANPYSAHSGAAAKVPSSNASLQGYAPPSAGTGSPFGGASSNLTGGGSANPFSRMAMMPGGSGAGAGGEGIPGEGSLGKSGLGTKGEDALSEGAGGSGEAAGAGGAAGEGEAAGAEAARAGEGEGMNQMPMGGSGGGGGQDKERQRQAWMNEDDSIWGVPDEDVGPIIG